MPRTPTRRCFRSRTSGVAGVRPDERLYAAVIDHANGYASAFSARVATAPVAIASPSIVEAYAASTDALRRLDSAFALTRFGELRPSTTDT